MLSNDCNMKLSHADMQSSMSSDFFFSSHWTVALNSLLTDTYIRWMKNCLLASQVLHESLYPDRTNEVYDKYWLNWGFATWNNVAGLPFGLGNIGTLIWSSLNQGCMQPCEQFVQSSMILSVRRCNHHCIRIYIGHINMSWSYLEQHLQLLPCTCLSPWTVLNFCLEVSHILQGSCIFQSVASGKLSSCKVSVSHLDNHYLLCFGMLCELYNLQSQVPSICSGFMVCLHHLALKFSSPFGFENCLIQIEFINLEGPAIIGHCNTSSPLLIVSAYSLCSYSFILSVAIRVASFPLIYHLEAALNKDFWIELLWLMTVKPHSCTPHLT